jgi:hypothetical protein
MSHSNWLQNQTLACTLNGKTPYETKDKKKPNLGGIQEFGAAAYVKDLKAGKLDARAKKGWFIGYNSESKGYRIYWPEKRSVTIKQNVVFNQNDSHVSDDMAIIYGEAQSEGEKDKVILASQIIMISRNLKKRNQTISQQWKMNYNLQKSLSLLILSLFWHSISNQTNQIQNITMTTNHHLRTIDAEKDKDHQKEPIKQWGLAALTTIFQEEDEPENKPVEEFIEDDDRCLEYPYDLLPDVALVGQHANDPMMLEKVLQGPDAKHWQEALEYKINQLQKFGTWEIIDLPHGHNTILCSEVLRVKRGPDGEVQSYRVRIVAGGHRQVEGVNYSKTFSATIKCQLYTQYLQMQLTKIGKLSTLMSKVPTWMSHWRRKSIWSHLEVF